MNLQITESATQRINALLIEHNEKFLRAFIKGGGCSGFQYDFAFESKINEDDFLFDHVLIDSTSAQYLNGAELNYKNDLAGAEFVFTNPNAQSTCGCGSSFSA